MPKYVDALLWNSTKTSPHVRGDYVFLTNAMDYNSTHSRVWHSIVCMCVCMCAYIVWTVLCMRIFWTIFTPKKNTQSSWNEIGLFFPKLFALPSFILCHSLSHSQSHSQSYSHSHIRAHFFSGAWGICRAMNTHFRSPHQYGPFIAFFCRLLDSQD